TSAAPYTRARRPKKTPRPHNRRPEFIIQREGSTMTTSNLKIGWIGAGRMGAQLVTRLLDAGYDVTVYNRTASKAQELADRGASVATRPVDLADRDLVFAMVSSSNDLEEVMLGDGGLLTGESSPRVIA